MPKKEPEDTHEVEAAALAYIRCSCGWVNRIELLRGKSDEDLALESGAAFVAHKDKKSKKK